MTLLKENFKDLSFINFEDPDLEEFLEGGSVSYWAAITIPEDEKAYSPMDRKVELVEKGNYKALKELMIEAVDNEFSWESYTITLILVTNSPSTEYSDLAIFSSLHTHGGFLRAVPGCFLDTFPSTYKIPSYILRKALSFSKEYQKGLPGKTQEFLEQLLEDNENYDFAHLLEEYALMLSPSEKELIITFWAVCYPLVAERAIDNSEEDYHSQKDTPFKDGFYYLMGRGSYQPFMSANRVKTFYKEIFGFYRKDFQELTKTMPSLSLQKLGNYSKLVSPDFLIEQFSKNRDKISLTDDFFEEGLLSSIPTAIPEKARKIVFLYLLGLTENEAEITEWHPRDVLEMLSRTPNPSPSFVKDMKNCRNLTELHSALVGANLEFRAEYSIPATANISKLEEEFSLEEVKPYSKLSELIESIEGEDDVTGEKFSLRLMDSYSDFMYAGNFLNNCIARASYYEKFLRGQSLLFTIEDGYRELIGAIEISNSKVSKGRVWEVSQIRGHGNSKLPFAENLREVIDEALNIFYQERPEAQEYLKEKAEKRAEDNNAVNVDLIRAFLEKSEESRIAEDVLEELSEFFLVNKKEYNNLAPIREYNNNNEERVITALEVVEEGTDREGVAA